MRVAVLSDIHGNLEALREVLADLDRSRAGPVLCLGDNIGYGPEPEAVARLIQARNIPCVMGNHELALVDRKVLEALNPIARESLLLTRKLLSKESIGFLCGLRPYMVFDDCLCVHGCPPDSVTTYLFQVPDENLRRLLLDIQQEMSFVGHTHELELVDFDGEEVRRTSLLEGVFHVEKGHRLIVNVGSVGQPRDGNNNAKYVVWDTLSRTIEVKFVPYDISVTAGRILELGFPEYNARRLW